MAGGQHSWLAAVMSDKITTNCNRVLLFKQKINQIKLNKEFKNSIAKTPMILTMRQTVKYRPKQ